MVWGIQNHKPFGWDILGLLLPVPRGCVRGQVNYFKMVLSKFDIVHYSTL